VTYAAFHIIANPNAMNIDSIKQSGIYVPPKSGFLSSATDGEWCGAS